MDRLDLISPETRFYSPPHPFVLESGAVLAGVRIAYRTWGILNNKRDNGVIVCHAFTGWADVEAWWEPLLGTGRVLDPTRDFILNVGVKTLSFTDGMKPDQYRTAKHH
jgi:homoserine O-acetyltransferase